MSEQSYRHRVEQAVAGAILSASADGAGGVMLDAGAICRALMTVMAENAVIGGLVCDERDAKRFAADAGAFLRTELLRALRVQETHPVHVVIARAN